MASRHTPRDSVHFVAGIARGRTPASLCVLCRSKGAREAFCYITASVASLLLVLNCTRLLSWLVALWSYLLLLPCETLCSAPAGAAATTAQAFLLVVPLHSLGGSAGCRLHIYGMKQVFATSWLLAIDGCTAFMYTPFCQAASSANVVQVQSSASPYHLLVQQTCDLGLQCSHRAYSALYSAVVVAMPWLTSGLRGCGTRVDSRPRCCAAR